MTQNRQKIHAKLRHTVHGTAERPRLAVYRSLTNVYAQLIDDEAKKTIASASSLKATGSLSEKAKRVGKEIAEAAKAKKVTTAVFDRGGFPYMGSVKLICETARENGLKI